MAFNYKENMEWLILNGEAEHFIFIKTHYISKPLQEIETKFVE